MRLASTRVVALLGRTDERRASSHAPAFTFALLLCATLLAGCTSDLGKTRVADSRSRASASIPLPSRTQLSPQPEPDCGFKASGSPDDRQRLDYERQCYRHAEIIARDRLERLQASVDRTVKAVNERN